MRKFIRLIKREPLFLLRALIVCGCLLFIASEMKILQLQSRQYRKIQQEKALVSRIPQMQKAIPPDGMNIVPTGAGLVLQGTYFEDDNTPYALINAAIFKLGDALGEYKVKEINQDAVILENPVTKEVKDLHLLEK